MTQRRKKILRLVLLAAVVLALFVAAGCAFTGTQKEAPAANDPPIYKDGGIQACLVRIDGSLYVWDYFEETLIDPEALSTNYEYLGAVQSQWRYAIPKEDLAACRLDAGTKLYRYTGQYFLEQGLYCYPSPKGDVGRLLLVDSIPVSDRWWKQDKDSLTEYEKLIFFRDALYRFTGQTDPLPKTVNVIDSIATMLYTGIPTENQSGTHISGNITAVSDDDQTLRQKLTHCQTERSLLIYEKTTQEAVLATPAIPMSVLRDTYLKSPKSPNWRVLEQYYHTEVSDGADSLWLYPVADEHFTLEVRNSGSGEKRYTLRSLFSGGTLDLNAENAEAFEVFSIPQTRPLTLGGLQTILTEKNGDLHIRDFVQFYHKELNTVPLTREYSIYYGCKLYIRGDYEEITSAEFYYQNFRLEVQIDVLNTEPTQLFDQIKALELPIAYSQQDIDDYAKANRDRLYAQAQGKLLRIFGELYVCVSFPVSWPLEYSSHQYTVTEFDPSSVPATEFSSNYFPVGSKIYIRNNDISTVYVQKPGEDKSLAMIPLLKNMDSAKPAMTSADLLRFVKEYFETGKAEGLTNYRHATDVQPNGNIYTFDIADAPYCLICGSINKGNPSQLISMCGEQDYNLSDPASRYQFFMDFGDVQPLTTDDLKTLVNQKQATLTPDDFTPYLANMDTSKDGIQAGYMVSDDYQLIIRVENEDRYHFELYHLDDPDTVIDLLADDLDSFLSRQLPTPRSLTTERLKWIVTLDRDGLTLSDFSAYRSTYTAGITEFRILKGYRLCFDDSAGTITLYNIPYPAYTLEFNEYPLLSIKSYLSYVEKAKNDPMLISIKWEYYETNKITAKLPKKHTIKYAVDICTPIDFNHGSKVASNYFPVGTEVYVNTANDDYIYIQLPGSELYIELIHQDLLEGKQNTHLTIYELYRLVKDYDPQAINEALSECSHWTIRDGTVARDYYDLAGSPYILQAHTPGKTVSVLTLMDVQGVKDYDLTDPEDRATFLAHWADKIS